MYDSLKMGDRVAFNNDKIGKIVNVIGSHIHISDVFGNVTRVKAQNVLGNTDNLIFAGLIFQIVNCINDKLKISINEIIDILIDKRKNGEKITIDNLNYFCELILEERSESHG